MNLNLKKTLLESDLNTDGLTETLINYFEGKNNYTKEFFENSFFEIAPEIFNIAMKDGSIDDEGILYFPEDYDFSQGDFITFTDVIMTYANKNEAVYEDRDFFVVLDAFVTFEDNLFAVTEMYGQGTSFMVSYIHPSKYDPNLSEADNIILYKDKLAKSFELKDVQI